MVSWVSDTMRPTHVFVGLFDILGFKALRERMGTSGLHQLFERGLAPQIEHAAAGRGKNAVLNGENVWVPDVNPSSLGLRIFSDTIVMFSKDDSVDSLLYTVRSASHLYQAALAASAPIRGAIGHGDIICDRSMILGSAIEDAYIHESRQAWSGVSLSPACLNFIASNNYLQELNKLYDAVDSAPLEDREKRASKNNI